MKCGDHLVEEVQVLYFSYITRGDADIHILVALDMRRIYLKIFLKAVSYTTVNVIMMCLESFWRPCYTKTEMIELYRHSLVTERFFNQYIQQKGEGVSHWA